jgi:hypothetical protein
MNKPNMPLAVQAIEDIATHAIDAMGDVFYEPDPDVDGYDPTTLFFEVKRVIIEAINKALQQAGVPRPDHLAAVLQLAQQGVADQLAYLASLRGKLDNDEFAELYDAANIRANKEAIAAIAQIAGVS